MLLSLDYRCFGSLFINTFSDVNSGDGPLFHMKSSVKPKNVGRLSTVILLKQPWYINQRLSEHNVLSSQISQLGFTSQTTNHTHTAGTEPARATMSGMSYESGSCYLLKSVLQVRSRVHFGVS